MIRRFAGIVFGIAATIGATAALASSLGTVVQRPAADRLWAAHVAVVDAALERDDVGSAVRAWHDGYGAALATREWEPMIAIGDAFRRIGMHARAHDGGKPNVRQAYMVALMRAERAQSAAGVRRTAEAFADIGDDAVAAQCLRIAERMK